MLPTIMIARELGLTQWDSTVTLSLKNKNMATRMTALTAISWNPRRLSPAMNWPMPGTIADARAAIHGFEVEGWVSGVDIAEMVSPDPR